MKISNIFKDHIKLINELEKKTELILAAGSKLTSILKNGNKILLMGNGGSAADSQHIAAELIGRFQKERDAIPAIALTTDTSILTAIGNDYSFDEIFKRQIQGLANQGDAVLGISTSGNSKNVIKALIEAKRKKAYTIALTGKDGGQLKDIADLSIIVPSNVTARIQEAHILVGHILCELIEEGFCG
ncbi:MAG: D-sedoheptulose 7-phosphate isomerase [Desulforegulaceae bacterium]|nr:D-sedoheptulose 7-phosphate isomerase [Desulforegulaceae bacterium]